MPSLTYVGQAFQPGVPGAAPQGGRACHLSFGENIVSVSQRLDGGKDATRKEDASAVVNYARLNSGKTIYFQTCVKTTSSAKRTNDSINASPSIIMV